MIEKNKIPAAMAGQTPRLKVLKMNDKGATCIIQNVRLTFVYLDKPSKDPSGDLEKGKYSVTAIIPASHFQAIKKEFTKLFESILKISKTLPTNQQRLAAMKTALNDGNDYSFFKIGNESKNKEGKIYPGVENAFTFQAKQAAINTENGPRPKFDLALKSRKNDVIPPQDVRAEFYSGVWADLAINVAPYEYMKKQSFTAYLNGVMKLADDERLGASDPFSARDDIADTSDNSAASYDFDEEDDEIEKPKKKGKK